MGKEKLRKIGKEIRPYLIVIGIMLITTYFVRPLHVNGHSMDNTLYDGEVLWGVRFFTPQRGDIVVAVSPEDEKIIKRIVGMPGDIITIQNDHVYINGETMTEPYIKEPMLTGWFYLSVSLKENEYFLMGDNRNDSTDSRQYGAFHQDKLLFKIVE